jgi:hypothetical protein
VANYSNFPDLNFPKQVILALLTPPYQREKSITTRAGRVAQVIERLPSKLEVLSSNTSTEKKKSPITNY